jgi:integrase/recombinase XerD
MSGTLAVIEPSKFDVAFPGGAARNAASLTEIWLRSLSDNTRTAYRRDLTAWLDWCEQCEVSPGQARIAHVDAWIARQRENGAADRSIARRVATVSSWYDYLIVNTAQDPEPLATHNPALTKARPKVDRDYSPTTSLSRVQADALIAAAEEHSRTAAGLIRLLLTEGLRVGSAINARIEDLGEDGGHQILTVRLKGGKTRKKPLPVPVIQALDAMLAERGYPQEGWLFVTPKGRQLYELWVWRLVRRLAATSPHGLRATAITELLRSGAPLHEAQDFADHADPRTTQIYNKNRHNLDKHGSYVLAARFASSAPTPPAPEGAS